MRILLPALVVAGTLPSAIHQALAQPQPRGGASLDIVVTASVYDGDSSQCGSDSHVLALRAQQINLCYSVTNQGSVDLHFLSVFGNSDEGRLLVHAPVDLPVGATVHYNRIVPAGTSQKTYTASATASDILPGFVASPDTGAFVDISTTGTATGTTTFNLPFRFPFYDFTDTQTMCLIDSGALQFFSGQQGAFGICGIDTMKDNSPMPVDFFAGSSDFSIDLSTRFPVSWAAVDWDYLADFFIGNAGGTMYTQTVGDAPFRQFIAQWSGFHHVEPTGGFSDGDITFQAVLDEHSSSIAYRYADTVFGDPAHPEWDSGGNASSGLQFGLDLYTQHSYDQPVLLDGTGLLWSPNGASIVTSSQAAATVDIAVPGVTASPGRIDALVEPGATAHIPLAVGNDGDVDLVWSIESTHARPPQPAFAPDWIQERIPQSSQSRLARHLPAAAALPKVATQAAGGISPAAYAMSFTNTVNGFNYSFDLLPRAADPSGIAVVTEYAASNTWVASGFVRNDFTRLFAISYPDGRLQTISTGDGGVDDIAPITGAPTIIQWNGLKWDPQEDVVYAMGLDGAAEPYLYRLDTATGEVTLVGDMNSDVAAHPLFVDIAIDSDGTMVAIDLNYDGLFSIDKSTGASTPIGPLGFDANYAQGMDFDHATGVLYLSGYDNYAGGGMYVVDASTGAATLLDRFPGFAEVYAFAVASFGLPCANPDNAPWLSVSPASGTTAPGGASNVDVSIDTTGLAPGSHDAALCLRTQDPTRPGLQVPVDLFVGTDSIFADGFD